MELLNIKTGSKLKKATRIFHYRPQRFLLVYLRFRQISGRAQTTQHVVFYQ